LNTKYKFPIIEVNKDLIKKAFYPEDLEEWFYDGNKLVLRPYEIEGEFIVTRWRSEDFCRQNKGPERISPKAYNPFHEENLLGAIIKVNINNKKSILKFCNQYGLLTVSNHKHKERIGDFCREVTKLKKCVEYYWNLENNIEGEITPELEPPPYLSAVIDVGDMGYNYFSLAEYHLTRTVDSYLRNIYPQIKNSPEGGYIPYFASSNLISVAYYHLFRLMTQNKQLKKCKKCGSFYVPIRSHSNFCPPPTVGERSLCQNSYDQMVYWSRRKILSGEKTVEEVAAIKGRPVEEVRKWIENYNPKK